MIDRIRRRGAPDGRQGLVRIFGPGATGHVWRVQGAPVAPVDEAEQQPGAEQEFAQLQYGGDHRSSSTATADDNDPHPAGAVDRRRRQPLDAVSTATGRIVTLS
ncbi:MAG: hypothetical protein ABWY29_04745 [Blastococcus sp.]